MDKSLREVLGLKLAYHSADSTEYFVLFLDMVSVDLGLKLAYQSANSADYFVLLFRYVVCRFIAAAYEELML